MTSIHRLDFFSPPRRLLRLLLIPINNILRLPLRAAAAFSVISAEREVGPQRETEGERFYTVEPSFDITPASRRFRQRVI